MIDCGDITFSVTFKFLAYADQSMRNRVIQPTVHPKLPSSDFDLRVVHSSHTASTAFRVTLIVGYNESHSLSSMFFDKWCRATFIKNSSVDSHVMLYMVAIDLVRRVLIAVILRRKICWSWYRNGS